MASLADYQADLARLTELSDEELNALSDNLIAAFDEADQGEADDAALEELAAALDTVRTELESRSSAGEPTAEQPPDIAAAAETVGTDTGAAPEQPAVTPDPPAEPPAEPPAAEPPAAEPPTPPAET